MIEQISNSVKFLAFFTSNKQGKTALTVTVDVYAPSGTQIVTDAAATAIGGGLYSYTLSSNNSTEGEYAAVFKTTDSTVDAQHIPSLWVLGRAGIENLDAATSSRFPSASYTAPDNTSIAGIKAKTDNLPAAPAAVSNIPTAAQNASAVRTELTTELGRLDQSVSSRLAGSAYTTPPTASAITSAVWAAADKTGYSLTSAERSAIATAVEQSILNESDGQAVLNAIVGAIGNQNIDQVALVAAIRSDLERAGGKLVNLDATVSSRLAASSYTAPTTPPTAAQNASAVRTELATELARVDVAVSSRLAPSGTLATVTNLTNAPASVTPSDIWSHPTRTITGGTVDTLTNAPTAPTPSAIASQVRTELQSELARIDQPISTRATPANIPASDITAIKAKTDALNTDRLAQVATTQIVGTLIAQANS